MLLCLFQEFAAADISLEMRRQLSDALYNEIITSVMKILDKLDLTSDPEQTSSEVSTCCVLEYLTLYIPALQSYKLNYLKMPEKLEKNLLISLFIVIYSSL